MTGSWGTNYLGYPRFGMPKPALLVLAYGASKTKANPGNFFFRSMVGDNPDPEMVKAVDITANVTPDYPATFLWQCKDDPLVPFEAAEAMDKALETAGVPIGLWRLKRAATASASATTPTRPGGWTMR